MNLQTLTLIVASVGLSALAQICFKFGLRSDSAQVAAAPLARLGAALLTPGVIAGLALYALGALLWLSALDRVQLSQAYPFVGLGFALTALAGWWLFGEDLSYSRIAGMLIIFAGIILVAQS